MYLSILGVNTTHMILNILLNQICKLNMLAADLQVTNELGKTRWLRVTPEQIQAILQILNEKADQWFMLV